MQKSSGATLRDVAIKAGVSKNAVSVVINGTRVGTRVSEATRQRIVEAAAELRYRPNALARGLASGRMNTIGIVSVSYQDDFIIGHYGGPLVQGVIDVASRRLQSTAIFYGHFWDEASRIMPAYCDGRNDGLLFIAPNRDLLVAVSETPIPLVVVGSHSQIPGVTGVDIDDTAATRGLIRHLLDRGHRRITFVGGPDINVDIEEQLHACFHLRYQAMRDTLVEAGLEPEKDLNIVVDLWCPEMWDYYSRELFKLLNRPISSRPTAIFAVNGEVAVFVVKMIREFGLRMPEDVSVVTFDDTPDIAAMNLTTIRQNTRQIGAKAAEILLALIDGEIKPGGKVYLETELIERGSVASVNF